MNPHVTYNGKEYYDASYVFTAEGCVSVSAEGKITATEVGLGRVIVEANWREAERSTLTVVLEIEVIGE